MFLFFLFIIIIPIIVVHINKQENFVEGISGSGIIMAELNSHKDITLKTDDCSVSDHVDTKEICILDDTGQNKACINKDDIKRIDQLHIKIKDSVCIDEECAKKKKLRYLKELWPPGTITIFKGDPNALPDGWQVCNGENGTPDLRDKFILGSGKDYRQKYKEIGKGLCGNSKGFGNRLINDGGILTSKNCKKHCDKLMYCTGYNITDDGTCQLWYDDISEKKLFTSMDSDGICMKKTITGGTNYHKLTIEEIPKHEHVFKSNNPGFDRGNTIGIKAEISDSNNVGEIHKHKDDFSNKLSHVGKNNAHENLPPYYSLYYVMKTDPKYRDVSLSLVDKYKELVKQYEEIKKGISYTT
jgi:microcystin-dependent protein